MADALREFLALDAARRTGAVEDPVSAAIQDRINEGRLMAAIMGPLAPLATVPVAIAGGGYEALKGLAQETGLGGYLPGPFEVTEATSPASIENVLALLGGFTGFQRGGRVPTPAELKELIDRALAELQLGPEVTPSLERIESVRVLPEEEMLAQARRTHPQATSAPSGIFKRTGPREVLVLEQPDPGIIRTLRHEFGGHGAVEDIAARVFGPAEALRPQSIESAIDQFQRGILNESQLRQYLEAGYQRGRPALEELATQARSTGQLPRELAAAPEFYARAPARNIGSEIAAYAAQGERVAPGRAFLELHAGAGGQPDIARAVGEAIDAIIQPAAKAGKNVARGAADIPLLFMDLLAQASPEYREQVLGGSPSVFDAFERAMETEGNPFGHYLNELITGPLRVLTGTGPLLRPYVPPPRLSI